MHSLIRNIVKKELHGILKPVQLSFITDWILIIHQRAARFTKLINQFRVVPLERLGRKVSASFRLHRF